MTLGPVTSSSAGLTNAGWAALLLQDVGAPITPNNTDNIMRWMTAEEPTSNWWDRNNPLNASLGTSASDGTGSYDNLSTGADYTAQMIHQSNMSGILAALMNNASPSDFSAAVVASPWASSHYGGSPGAIASIPVPSVVDAGQAAGQSTATPAGTGGYSGNPVVPAGTGWCNSKNQGIAWKFGGVLGVGSVQITWCEVKAMISAWEIVAGVTIIAAGVVIVVGFAITDLAIGRAASRAVRTVARGVPGR